MKITPINSNIETINKNNKENKVFTSKKEAMDLLKKDTFEKTTIDCQPLKPVEKNIVSFHKNLNLIV